MMNKCLILVLCFTIFVGCSKNDESDGVIIDPSEALGCTDASATNFSSEALFPDNSCTYPAITCDQCDYLLDPSTYGFDNDILKIPVGSVICFPAGQREAAFFNNFHGTADKPYKFINCGGQVKIFTTTTAAVRFFESSFIRFTGTGSADEYGFQIDAGKGDYGFVAERRSTDFEVDHIEILGSKNSGLSIRTDPTCDGGSNRGAFVQKNTIIHHNKIANTAFEGLYIGGSHWHSGLTVGGCSELLSEPELKGVKIYNNVLENIGRDGIQVGSAIEDSEIYNNIVNGFGKTNEEYHQAGIQINPGTTGKVYNNYILNGSGRGIFLSGFDLLIFNNIVVNTGRDGVITIDAEPISGKGFYVLNNTFYNIKGDMLEMISNKTSKNVMYNNVGVNIEGEIMKEGNANIVIDVQSNVKSSDLSEIGFVDPDKGDFRLLGTSSLIDGGKSVDSYKIKFDFLFNNRISGEGIDIGAHEFKK